MGKFGDVTQYFDPGLTVTVLKREYTLPLPSAEMGLWCRTMAETAGVIDSDATDDEVNEAVAAVDDLPELPGKLTFPERMLGDVYQQMVADKVPDPYIQFCARTVYIWIIGGEEMAERYWTAGGRPEAMARGNRASRRATASKTSTDGASGTRSRASSSGTSSPRTSGKSATGSGSRGRRS